MHVNVNVVHAFFSEGGREFSAAVLGCRVAVW